MNFMSVDTKTLMSNTMVLNCVTSTKEIDQEHVCGLKKILFKSGNINSVVLVKGAVSLV